MAWQEEQGKQARARTRSQDQEPGAGARSQEHMDCACITVKQNRLKKWSTKRI